MSSLYDGPIIDAHHHLWDLESGRYSWLTDGPREVVFGSTEPLIRDYLVANYLADMASIDLVKSVHIQASFFEDPVAETRWLQGIADENGFPHGIVAYALLEEPDAEGVLEAHCAHANMRGIRQILSWHKNPTWTFHERSDLMQDAAWRRGFGLLRRYNLSFDMMIYSGQLGDALDLARAFPDTQNHPQSHRQPRRPGRRGHRGMARRASARWPVPPMSRSRFPTSAPTTTIGRPRARGPSSATPSTPSARSAARSRAIFRWPGCTVARMRSTIRSRPSLPTSLPTSSARSSTTTPRGFIGWETEPRFPSTSSKKASKRAKTCALTSSVSIRGSWRESGVVSRRQSGSRLARRIWALFETTLSASALIISTGVAIRSG